MTIEETLEAHYRVAYQRELGLEYQQEMEELKGTTDEDYNFVEPGESFTFDWIGQTKVRKIEDRYGPTPKTSGPGKFRRVGHFEAFEVEDPLGNKIDNARSVADPANRILQAQKAGVARHHDLQRKIAIVGPAYEGKHGTVQKAYPAANHIDVDNHDYDDDSGDTGFTVTKVQALKVAMDALKVPKKDRFISCAGHFIAQLLRDPMLSSKDFNTVQAMVSGEVAFWHGFHWRPHEDWDDVMSAPAGSGFIHAWQKDAVQYRSRVIKAVDIFKRKEARDNWWSYGEMESAGIRGYDKGVWRIEAKI